MKTQCIGKSAFDTVYDANMENVYKVALHYSGNHDRAQDITQQVFMKLYINMENINMSHVEAWLKTTVKHIALNERKITARRNRHEQLMADVESTVDKVVYLESLEDSFASKLSIKERAELAEQIYADLYQKNERWYEAMTITYVLQKPQKEVAKTMGVSLSVLQMMLYRAKNWIRKHYQKQYDHLDEA